MGNKEEKILKELKQSLKALLGDSLIKMLLFGSKARGDYTRESDIDVAIIVRGLTRELKKEIITRIAEKELAYYVPISTIVLSKEEFDRLKKRERRIALDIEKEGIPI